MNIQVIIVYAIGIAAIAYIIYRIYRQVTGKGKKCNCGCGNCTECPPSDNRCDSCKTEKEFQLGLLFCCDYRRGSGIFLYTVAVRQLL